MSQGFFLLLMSCLFNFIAPAQNNAPATQQPVTAKPSYNYIKLNPQLSYAFIINKPTTAHPQEGGQITVNMQSIYGSRIMYSTASAFNGKPGVFGVAKPAYKGDLIEAIMLMTPGDSIVCLVDADTVYKNSNTKKPDFIKKGDKLQYFIKLVSVKTKEQVQKEQQAAFMKQMKEQEAKQKAATAKQLIADEKKLKAYFASNKLSPVKTSTGMYYNLREEGTGNRAMPGDSVSMNYTGRLLNGTKFDSNEDSAFFHVMPYNFILGTGVVIKGWDEGISYLKPGDKATFYIPSSLAYGPQARPGAGANAVEIPANSILIFDVQLLSVKSPVRVLPEAPHEAVADTVATPIKNQ